MPRRPLLLLLIAAVVAAVCVRLGIWQLDRLQQRRTANALVSSRLDSAVVAPAALPADTTAARYRRVRVSGSWDYANEIVLSGRAREGSPGVNLLTPLRVAGADTAILVNRGWVYAPDATTMTPSEWREADTATVTGFVTTFRTADSPLDAVVPGRMRTLRYADAAALDSLLPYPFAPYTVTMVEPLPADPARAPARLTPPPLDEGSHLSYAFQWFSFAAIALGGALVMFWSARSAGRKPVVVPPPPRLPGEGARE
jgi:surfeit locus 1 family protein